MGESVLRPKISQAVIDGFTAIVDQQDKKGLNKYNRSIDDADDNNYDWRIMALEECADQLKYLVREIKRLEMKYNISNLTKRVLLDVEHERFKQNEMWGLQHHDYPYWLTILAEEFGEVAQAMQKDSYSYKDSDADDLYKELIQVAAVAVAIAEQVREERWV